MLMLVLADNFLLLFFFWEGVGLASYLLIGFWFTRRSAAGAAQKAFIVNRIGDLAFGLGLIWIFYQFGTLDFSEVFAQVPAAPAAVVTGIALLLFGGAAGKSAQFPLHVWLPDAMEGPTPVSALIHAATMVTAGIYLIVRAHTFYEYAPTAMLVVALIGAFTSFMAATIAVAQNDIKRVIAYSTLSQLGYMALGAGVGAFIPAIFHLVTHAFFKGCLFLGAGSVIHGMHEEQNIQSMGGLRRWMPVTFWTFLAASFANAGHDPLRRVLVEGRDHRRRLDHGSDPAIGQILAIVGLVTAFFTAFYMFRLVFLVFTGEPRFDPHDIHPHESPPSMAIPLVLLAIPSVALGWLIGWPPEAGSIHTFLEPVFARRGRHRRRGRGRFALHAAGRDAPRPVKARAKRVTAPVRPRRKSTTSHRRRSSPSASPRRSRRWRGIGLAYADVLPPHHPGAGRARVRPLSLPARQMALGRALQRRDRAAAGQSGQRALAGGRRPHHRRGGQRRRRTASARSASACAMSRPVWSRTTRWRSRSAWSCWSGSTWGCRARCSGDDGVTGVRGWIGVTEVADASGRVTAAVSTDDSCHPVTLTPCHLERTRVTNFPYLSVMTFLPMLGALVIFFIPRITPGGGALDRARRGAGVAR